MRVREGQWVLFHILNGSATENIQLALPGHKFQIVALDGNPVPRPQSVEVLELGTAERISAVVEMKNPGIRVLGTRMDDDRKNGMGIIVVYANRPGAPRWVKLTARSGTTAYSDHGRRRGCPAGGIFALHEADRDRVSDPKPSLMTTTTRICLDILTSARARHEEYVDPGLPEPVMDTRALAPDSRTELAEDPSVVLLLILNQLSPMERAALLPHEMFDVALSAAATALKRSEAACRQFAARGRAYVREVRPRGVTRHAPSGGIDAKHSQLMPALTAATQSGDLKALMQLLALDVRILTDGGGKVQAH